MRAGACTILGIGVILIATPVWAAGGRYDPDYPVCMEAISSEGTRIDCMYTSMEQCRQGTYGSSGTCFNNPNYVPRPAEAAPTPTEPAPTAKTGKSAGRYDPDYPVYRIIRCRWQRHPVLLYVDGTVQNIGLRLARDLLQQPLLRPATCAGGCGATNRTRTAGQTSQTSEVGEISEITATCAIAVALSALH